MRTRYLTLLTLPAVLLALAAVAKGPDEKAAEKAVRTLLSEDLTGTIDGRPARATVLEVTWGPGESTPPHRHPGPTLVYVVEGELETQVGDGPLRRLKASEAFSEPSMALHAVTRNPSRTARARAIAVHIHPRKVDKLLIPEPGDMP